MASTLLLSTDAWDLVIDASGNIAVASEPYALAQDAASAIKTFLGEVYYDTTIGVPYDQIFGVGTPSLEVIKAQLALAAEMVPDVASAQVFITGITDRTLTGQVQVTSAATGQVSVAPFTTIDPIGP